MNNKLKFAPNEELKFKKITEDKNVGEEKFLGFNHKELVKMFRMFDTNRNGELDLNELLLMGDKIGISNEKMTKIFRELDFDNNGVVTLEEWFFFIVNLDKTYVYCQHS